MNDSDDDDDNGDHSNDDAWSLPEWSIYRLSSITNLWLDVDYNVCI